MKTNTMNSPTLKPASIGSVSSGTLRDEDLLSSFSAEVEYQIQRNESWLALPENLILRDHLYSIGCQTRDFYNDIGGFLPDSESLAEFIDETLFDALNTFAPPFCYFGANPGDGADFGFWPCMEQIDELPTVEDSDAAKALGEDCKSVNDHGNVTVYGADGSIILELV
jgi:hypothetical protein